MHISGMAEAFEREGYEIVFSSPTGIDPRKNKGGNPFKKTNQPKPLTSRIVEALPSFCFEFLEIGYNLLAWWQNRKHLKENPVSIIYERHAFFLFATALLCRSRKIPLITEVNELIGDERIREQPLLKSFAQWADRITFQTASWIIVVSPHLKRRIEATGIDGEKILVMPNAIHPEEFIPQEDTQTIRKQLKRAADETLMSFVGWFVPWHYLDRLLSTFAKIAKDHPKAHLILYGDGELKDSLKAQAEELGIRSQVHFPGPVTHDQIANHLNAADICLIPHSNAYRSPIKLFEYMALGKAILAPAKEPIEMVVTHEKHALLFESENESALLENMKRLLSDPKLRRQLGENAKSHVLKNHTWDQNAQEILKRLPRH